MRTLGGASLARCDVPPTPIALQPKRLALLVFLLCGRPRPLSRRDAVAALFWPELDQQHARAALSEALRYLRRLLGDDVVLARGQEEVGIDATLVWCDAAAFETMTERDVASAPDTDPLALYEGPFLSGFFVDGAAPEFDEWIDQTRARLQDHASRLASAASVARQGAGDLTGAVDWARRAVELSPGHEQGIRCLIALLDRAGDRAGALALYDRWKNELDREYGVGPAPETELAIREVRQRSVARPETAAENRPERESQDGQRAPLPPSRSRSSRALLGALGLAIAMGVGAVVWSARTAPEPGRGSELSVAVLPLKNATGDSVLEFLAHGLGRSVRGTIGRRLGLSVAPEGQVAALLAAGVPGPEIGRRLRTALVLEWRLERVDGLVSVDANVIATDARAAGWRSRYPLDPSAPIRLERRLVNDFVRRLRLPSSDSIGAEAGARDQAVHLLDFEAQWRLQRRDVGEMRVARDLYLKAIELDPLAPAAYAGLAMAYSGLSYYGGLPPDEGFPRAEAAARKTLEIDPDNSVALGVLASSLAAFRWDWVAADREFKRVIASNPADPTVRNTYGIMLRQLHRYDESLSQFREAARLEPLSRHYQRQIARVLLCSGRTAAGIDGFRAALAIDSSYAAGWAELAFGLAAAGRFDDAIGALRNAARIERDSESIGAFAGLSGSRGYRDALRVIGERSLRQLDDLRSSGRYASEADYAAAYRWLGREDEMYRRLLEAVDRHDVRVLNFDCPPDGLPWKPDPRLAEIRRRIEHPDSPAAPPPPGQARTFGVGQLPWTATGAGVERRTSPLAVCPSAKIGYVMPVPAGRTLGSDASQSMVYT